MKQLNCGPCLQQIMGHFVLSLDNFVIRFNSLRSMLIAISFLFTLHCKVKHAAHENEVTNQYSKMTLLHHQISYSPKILEGQ